MNKKFLIVAILMLGLFFSISLFAGGQQDKGNNSNAVSAVPGVPTIEIIYLNHSPVRKVIAKIDDLLGQYGDRISVVRYTFSSSEGKSLADSRKLKGHIPLVIFIDASMDFKVDKRPVKFYSFPQGQGTGIVADGAWSIEDLKLVLDRILE